MSCPFLSFTSGVLISFSSFALFSISTKDEGNACWAYLIILRGSIGSGKSSIVTQIKQIFGGKNNTVILDLDRTGEEFTQEILRALDYENVVEEISDGASPTTDPQKWIHKFKDKGCIILSVILLSTLETCDKRVKNRTHIATDNKIDLSRLK